MGQYRVTCTVKAAAIGPPVHGHIVRIGTEDENGQSRLWTVREVYEALDRDDTFYTYGPQSRKVALVEKYRCQPHNFDTLRTDPDAVTDNNLDNLPKC
jgi:hypothetical protein